MQQRIFFEMIYIFIIGYLAIAFEQHIRINKAASALLTGVFCWVVLALQGQMEVMQSMGEIASILFFLLGAMTIVELIDLHEGFDVIRKAIHSTSYNKLLLVVAVLAFFLSAVLDNLTTAIIMTSLISRLIQDPMDRRWFAMLVILLSNAGGAWSPIGDVTTTMLWMGGQLTPAKTIHGLFFPALAVSVVPVLYMMYRFRNRKLLIIPQPSAGKYTLREELMVLILGIVLLLSIPVFKALTGLPPFMGMLMALGIMWVFVSLLHHGKPEEDQTRYSVAKALQQIDAPGILFFLGILLSIEALSHAGLLQTLAEYMRSHLSGDYAYAIVLGLLSALIDNVPLVAAAQEMFANVFPTDHRFWQLLALSSGTGGSIVIIGSAAGVAVMGMEDIPFGWYLRKAGWLALLGFLAGVGVFALMS